MNASTNCDLSNHNKRAWCNHELTEAAVLRNEGDRQHGEGAQVLTGTSAPPAEPMRLGLPGPLDTGSRPTQLQFNDTRVGEGERHQGEGAQLPTGTSVPSVEPMRPSMADPLPTGSRPTKLQLAGIHIQQKTEPKARHVVATAELISKAPVGNNNHRTWKRQAEPMKTAIERWSREVDRRNEASCHVAGRPAWEIGLTPKPSPPRTQIAKSESFKWVARPEGDMFAGEIYPDGSGFDGPNPELMRCGWSFAVKCFATGEAIASAMGVPRPWITDIGGAEVWAMLQAGIRVLPGERSRSKGDCKACIDVIHGGIVVATSAKRALVRVYWLLLPALEDIYLSCILWMLAHKSAALVGKLMLSKWELLTQQDVDAHDMNGFAKRAVE